MVLIFIGKKSIGDQVAFLKLWYAYEKGGAHHAPFYYQRFFSRLVRRPVMGKNSALPLPEQFLQSPGF